MNIKSRYESRVPTKGTTFVEPSQTLQSEYPETTIDYYLKRYSATGQLGDPIRAQHAHFEDVSSVGDFQEMQNKVLQVRNAFMELPAEERRLYGDDPAVWVQAQIDAALAAQSAQTNQPSQPIQTEPSAEPATTPANQAKNE